MSGNQSGYQRKSRAETLLEANPRTLDELWECILPDKCMGCKFHKNRRQIVPNRGTGSNGIMLIGQNPGEDEDIDGIPFVGPAGKLLDTLLKQAFIKPDECWLTNACKCHSYRNQKPEKEELCACRPILVKEVALFDPLCIVTVGKPAMDALLDVFSDMHTIGRMVGRILHSPVLNRNFMPIYHTAYVLRSEENKAKQVENMILQHLDLAKGIAKTEGVSRGHRLR